MLPRRDTQMPSVQVWEDIDSETKYTGTSTESLEYRQHFSAGGRLIYQGTMRMTELQMGSETDDSFLVDRFKHGDRAAFDALFHRHKDGVYSLVYRTVGPDLADDITQEAFTQIHRSLPKFRGDSQFKTWMYCITMNVCRSAIRHRKS